MKFPRKVQDLRKFGGWNEKMHSVKASIAKYHRLGVSLKIGPLVIRRHKFQPIKQIATAETGKSTMCQRWLREEEESLDCSKCKCGIFSLSKNLAPFEATVMMAALV